MLTTIRTATKEDLPAVRALVHEPIDEASLVSVPGEHYMLVLDDEGGGLAAVAELVLDNDHGHLEFLAVADRTDHRDVEARVRDVAESICEAFGAEHRRTP
jgi:hypothetical protein